MDAVHPAVQAIYHDYLDVFIKKKPDCLPPHQGYDGLIDLLPEAAIPIGGIFLLSDPELVALQEYVDQNLEKDFICLFSSPTGMGIFLVEKTEH